MTGQQLNDTDDVVGAVVEAGQQETVTLFLLIQPHYEGREVIKALQGCRTLGVDWICGGVDYAEPDSVPIGDVEFCESVLSHHGYARPVPDFYPDFLHGWMHRRWDRIRVTGPEFLTCPMFVKSGDGYKVGATGIRPEGYRLPRGIVCLSEPVAFVQEWRYYVANGEVLASGWYDGNDEDEPAPILSVAWPETFSGAVDFGRLTDGRIALIESHHPYACGWYGDDSEMWVLWLIEGWRSMLTALKSAPTMPTE